MNGGLSRASRDADTLPECAATYGSVMEAFEQQAARSSCATALVPGDATLSYAELNRRANHLAHVLIAQGIGPECFVGIAVERSFQMVVALWAVLKSGAAYLPLDPDYPVARLAHMLADAAPALVLTTRSLRTRLPQSATCLLLDELVVDVLPAQELRPTERNVSVLPRSPAYVIYTSGSTGIPKGVVVEHQALSVFIDAIAEYVAFAPGDRHLAVTTLSFDISIVELILPLLHGATVVLVSNATARDPAALCAAIREMQATSLQATPTHWRLLLDQDPGCLKNLRAFSGGEKLPRDLATKLANAAHQLCNLYGPTEATVWASAVLVNDAAEASTTVGLGRALSQYRIRILDAALEPVPAGTAGELYIAGPALARGYLNRSGLTAERFIADPHGGPGTRMYRSGDLACWQPGGGIAYLGRADQQVKIRGYRIEPGEIEAALAAFDAVRQVVVVPREMAGDTRLVAYLVPHVGRELPCAATLRARLATRLPDYMLPSAFVTLETLPATPNGKLDRAALPLPGCVTPSHALPAPALAATEIEQRLAELWKAVLGLDPIDHEADFFELGGHSLLAVRLLSLIEAAFGRRIGLPSLFLAPTISGFARLLQYGDHGVFAFRQVERLYPASPERPLFAINSTGAYFHLGRVLGSRVPIVAPPASRAEAAALVDARWRDMRPPIRPRADESVF